MWRYQQSNGYLSRDETFVAIGYSGHGEGVNNPAFQGVRNIGPVPQGRYKLGVPYHDTERGPCVMPLIAESLSQLLGRSGFLIHGDNKELNQTASHGCIILPRDVRERIAASEDHNLEVIA